RREGSSRRDRRSKWSSCYRCKGRRPRSARTRNAVRPATRRCPEGRAFGHWPRQKRKESEWAWFERGFGRVSRRRRRRRAQRRGERESSDCLPSFPPESVGSDCGRGPGSLRRRGHWLLPENRKRPQTDRLRVVAADRLLADRSRAAFLVTGFAATFGVL